ncbi:hemolysin family protein [Cephaloticoccus primus]|uniref:hemolysin family protein n=1 Tax=Cephaloticoccus primus TaxID=1548207 RepID=UPI000A99383A|nr:hemolysin family protein [Cephaloticoccus primus]
MNAILLELLVIFLLLLANGAFAMAEIAIVSSRKARLQALADEGAPRARAALKLASEPTRFLSTVQIGITLIGILAGAFGGATLSDHLAAPIATIPLLAPYAKVLAIFIVVSAITYCSLIVGELAPKRIALGNPEARAMLVAGPMARLSQLAAPFVWLLTISTNGLLRVLGVGKETEQPPSEEEIANLIEEGMNAGVFHKAERAMVEGVLNLDEMPVTEIMTRRPQMVWLNVEDEDEINWRKIVTSGHSQFPVYENTRDQVIGVVTVKSLWANAAIGVSNKLRDHLTTPLLVPESVSAIQLLETFKKTGRHLALVTDEFGGIQGLVTLIDVMEAIVGDMPQLGDRKDPGMEQQPDGSWLVDAALSIEDLDQALALQAASPTASYETVGGFMIHHFGHVPTVGDAFLWQGWKLEVAELDGHRIDKVRAQPLVAPTAPAIAEPSAPAAAAPVSAPKSIVPATPPTSVKGL